MCENSKNIHCRVFINYMLSEHGYFQLHKSFVNRSLLKIKSWALLTKFITDN